MAEQYAMELLPLSESLQTFHQVNSHEHGDRQLLHHLATMQAATHSMGAPLAHDGRGDGAAQTVGADSKRAGRNSGGDVGGGRSNYSCQWRIRPTSSGVWWSSYRGSWGSTDAQKGTCQQEQHY
jgi:hypothetical protein